MDFQKAFMLAELTQQLPPEQRQLVTRSFFPQTPPPTGTPTDTDASTPGTPAANSTAPRATIKELRTELTEIYSGPLSPRLKAKFAAIAVRDSGIQGFDEKDFKYKKGRGGVGFETEAQASIDASVKTEEVLPAGSTAKRGREEQTGGGAAPPAVQPPKKKTLDSSATTIRSLLNGGAPSAAAPVTPPAAVSPASVPTTPASAPPVAVAQ